MKALHVGGTERRTACLGVGAGSRRAGQEMKRGATHARAPRWGSGLCPPKGSVKPVTFVLQRSE